MHYVLEARTDENFDLTCSFIEDDYDKFLQRYSEPELSIFDVNNLWFICKAKIVHDIGKTFCGNCTLSVIVDDCLFPTITCDFDLKKHDLKFDDCLQCNIKDYFLEQSLKYDDELVTMLNTFTLE